MADIFDEDIAHRPLDPTCLVLGGSGTDGVDLSSGTGARGTSTYFWEGSILKDDWVMVPGLADCLGIICIARTPTKQYIPQPVAAVANTRVSSNRDSVRDISRKTVRYSQLLEDHLQKKANPERNSRSSIEGVDAYKTYLIHGMGVGHFLAKERIESVFAKHPNKDSLIIYLYCTNGSGYGQREWLIRQRGEKNIIMNSTNAYDAYVEGEYCTLYASPQKMIENPWRKVHKYKAGDGIPLEISKLRLPVHELNANDKLDVGDDEAFKPFSLREVNDASIQLNWNDLNQKYAHHLTTIDRSQWHKKKNCELCNKEFATGGKQLYAFLSKSLYYRHHCRACGKSVCKNCCKKVSRMGANEKTYIADDPNLASYICKKCNSREW